MQQVNKLDWYGIHPLNVNNLRFINDIVCVFSYFYLFFYKGTHLRG